MNVFDEFAIEYDRWFDIHRFAYQSEVEAARRFVPDTGLGVDIGVGTGRFSAPFSIIIGVDPSEAMAAIARSRGVTVHLACAEDLPFCADHFDFALMITSLCFLDNPQDGLKEVYRILKPGGQLILGIIDRETQLGNYYKSMKSLNKFYRGAVFYSTAQVLDLLRSAGFSEFQVCQTIFSHPDMMTAPEPVLEGYGKGAFVVIRSIKQSKETE